MALGRLGRSENGNHVTIELSSLSSKLSLEVSAKFTEMYRGNSALLSTVIRGFSWKEKDGMV